MVEHAIWFIFVVGLGICIVKSIISIISYVGFPIWNNASPVLEVMLGVRWSGS